MSEQEQPEWLQQGFAVKDCALIAIATGKRAYSLKEFRDTLQEVATDSIYYHFWGGLLQPRFEEREFNNDFAGWARHALHDGTLAERLAVVDPTEAVALDELRQDLLELVEERLDEEPYLHWFHATTPFEFIRSQIVVFDTHHVVLRPEDLPAALARMSASSIFYHFVDARRRSSNGEDDFRAWMHGLDGRYQPLCAQLAEVDPFFVSLVELRQQLLDVFTRFFSGEPA